MNDFKIKDSGKRMQFSTGMQRDPDESKIRYDLIYLPMLTRWAEHMSKCAIKYSPRNWEKAETPAELDRFLQSAFRHFIQWFEGQDEEDHASACWFNICGAEMVKLKLGNTWQEQLRAWQLEQKEIIGVCTEYNEDTKEGTIKLNDKGINYILDYGGGLGE